MFSSTNESETPFSGDIPTPVLPPQQAGTIIAKGVKVEGEFKSEGDVVIDGEVQGNIESKGSLTVGNDAIINADLKAEEAHISGQITGNVTVKSLLVLRGSASVKGDITCERITVESGSTIEGQVRVGVSNSAQERTEQKEKSDAIKTEAVSAKTA